MFQSVQAECEKAQSQQKELQHKLIEMDKSQAQNEETIRELTAERDNLRLDLATLKQRGWAVMLHYIDCCREVAFSLMCRGGC